MSDRKPANDRAPQLLAQLADTVASLLVENGIAEEKAVDIGVAVSDKIRNDWGGEPIYIPKGMAIDISRRDMQIWEQFNGTNHRELAHKHDVTVIHLYRIIKAVRAAMLKSRHGDLFDDMG
jgi:Mor family transcriptional regulator